MEIVCLIWNYLFTKIKRKVMFKGPVYYPHAAATNLGWHNTPNGWQFIPGEGNHNPAGGYNNPAGVTLPNPNVSGIYIWGFIYECDVVGNPIRPVGFSDPININLFINNNYTLLPNWKFIPYYTGKIEANIMGRLAQHINVRVGVGSPTRYIRFSHSYMTKFYSDVDFPIRVPGVFAPYAASIAAKIATNPCSIEYLNGPGTLPLIYPGIVPVPLPGGADYPITLQNFGGMPIHDTLSDIVNGMNNFWFCYLPLPEVNEALLREYERFTFWALKGKTVSQTVNYNPLSWAGVPPIANGGQVIFKTDAAGNLVAAPIFPGY